MTSAAAKTVRMFGATGRLAREDGSYVGRLRP